MSRISYVQDFALCHLSALRVYVVLPTLLALLRNISNHRGTENTEDAQRLLRAPGVDDHPGFARKLGGPLFRRLVTFSVPRRLEYFRDRTIRLLSIEQPLQLSSQELATLFADVGITYAFRSCRAGAAADLNRILLAPTVESRFIFARTREAPG